MIFDISHTYKIFDITFDHFFLRKYTCFHTVYSNYGFLFSQLLSEPLPYLPTYSTLCPFSLS